MISTWQMKVNLSVFLPSSFLPQDRLARCTMYCNDKAKDSIDAGSKELHVKQQLETCVTKCVDDHMNLIPTMTRKMKESLSSMGK